MDQLHVAWGRVAGGGEENGRTESRIFPPRAPDRKRFGEPLHPPSPQHPKSGSNALSIRTLLLNFVKRVDSNHSHIHAYCHIK